MHSSNAPLVGLVGFAQAGKDTFARFMKFRKLAFAEALRDLAYESMPLYREAVLQHGYEWSKANIDWFRPFLQDFGMAMRKNFGEDVWVNLAFKDWDPTVPTVIPDTRFPNEITAIRERGGIIIRIDRVGHKPANDHISEHAWLDCNPDEHFTFEDGALHHMELVAISVAGRLLTGIPYD